MEISEVSTQYPAFDRRSYSASISLAFATDLSLRTEEGDLVNISFQNEQSLTESESQTRFADGVAIREISSVAVAASRYSISVQGDLNDEELEAIQRLVTLILKREDYQVLLAASAHQALEVAIVGAPHLVILDLYLPDMNGITVCRELRTWYKGPIVILSGDGDEAMVIEALEAGANDYLTKPLRPVEMLARIRALFRRYAQQPARSPVIRAGDLKVDLAKRRVFHDGREIRFTRTEFEILVYLAQNLDRVLTSKMILDKIWGPSHGDYLQTLRVHMGHLRRKIEPDPASPRLILTEPGVGYRLAAPSGEGYRSVG